MSHAHPTEQGSILEKYNFEWFENIHPFANWIPRHTSPILKFTESLNYKLIYKK